MYVYMNIHETTQFYISFKLCEYYFQYFQVQLKLRRKSRSKFNESKLTKMIRRY